MAAPRTSPQIVAIAGGSGSGKTTLARAVADLLGDRCAVLEHDAYYRCLGHLPAAQRGLANFDHPDSLDNELLAAHLQQLRRGRPVLLPRYDFATHMRLAEGVPVAPRPVIVVEGILVLSLPRLQRQFDLRVFVDAPEALRYRRRRDRDVVERGRTEVSVRQQWQASVRPMHERFVAAARDRCDLLLAGTGDVAGGAGRIVAALAGRTAAAGAG
ncbi:MAG: uridine kinase [Planctomycetes bacterium]|nr:uridine kinase [Planctomycetota bacterium]